MRIDNGHPVACRNICRQNVPQEGALASAGRSEEREVPASRIGHDVHVVLGSERNMKITKPADMELARFYLEREKQKA